MAMMNHFKRLPKRFLLFTLLSCYVLFRVFYFTLVTSRMKTEILVKPMAIATATVTALTKANSSPSSTSVIKVTKSKSSPSSLIKATEANSSILTSVIKVSSWVIKANAWSKQGVLTPRADCKRIINGDKKEIARAKKIMKNYPKKPISCQTFLNLTKNCSNYKNERGYILRALRKREKEFPIAYSMMIYKDIEQFERLLRAIYRPQNYYCIHIDIKSPKIFHRAVQGISDCFPNVFIASKLVEVTWAGFLSLQAYLNCMGDLYKRYKDWKYFINISGQEFPLRTNNELVKRLKRLEGKSMVGTTKILKKGSTWNRFHYIYKGRKRTNVTKTPFRYNFTFYKGSSYVALSHSFANYTLNSQVANEFLEWVKDTGFPDETFLPSLIGNAKFPSPAKPRDPKESITRHVNWGGKPCQGKIVRQICINGVGDLAVITKGSELFVNKFHLSYQHLALDCMEEWFYNKTLDYYQGKLKTSTSVKKKRR